jgi:hypothetical protein
MANPTLMSMPICRDAEKNTIPATDNGTTGKFSEQYGWQGINSLPLSAGGKAVERLDFNGVLALLGGIDYMTQRGYTFEYDNSLPYVVGCIVVDPLDGKTYRCINDVPIGASNPSNDTINWVSHDIADYVGGALRGKAYNEGDTSTLVGIPAGYFLECTTAGTTGATAPVITPPVSAGQTISDGTVVWTVRSPKQAEYDFSNNYLIPIVNGYLVNADVTYKIGVYKTNSSTYGLPEAGPGFLEVYATSNFFNTQAYYMQRWTSARYGKTYSRAVVHPSAEGAGWTAWSALN